MASVSDALCVAATASVAAASAMADAAATDAVAGSESAVVDMTGAQFDFTQVGGFDSNALEVQVVAVSGQVTAPSGIYIVSVTDSIVMNLTFQSVEVETLAGYFGQLTEGASADVALLDTVPLPEPSIDLEGTTASQVDGARDSRL